MQGLASFDRWLAHRAAPAATIAATPVADIAATRYLIAPRRTNAVAVAHDADAATLLRAAHGLTDGDWLGLLADDARRAGARQAWRLAFWREGRPQWIGDALVARPGQNGAALRRAALAAAVDGLWANGWRLVDAGAPRRV